MLASLIGDDALAEIGEYELARLLQVDNYTLIVGMTLFRQCLGKVINARKLRPHQAIQCVITNVYIGAHQCY
jgi:hypothetical protein